MELFSIGKINLNRDLQIVDELVGELHESELQFNPRTAQWKDIREVYLQHIAECLDECSGSFFIAEQDNRAIGFIFGYVDDRDNSNFEIGDGDDLYVSEGYVKKEYRKMGVYTALNQVFEDHYKNITIRRIYRFTLTNNTVMQNWLAKQGYSPVRILYEKWIGPVNRK